MSVLALTFDDGPDPVWTPRLLDLLGELDARATFFPIATRAAAHPGLIERMLVEGHSVEVHCREHVRHTERSDAWLREDTAAAAAILAELGASPRLWRPPWGITAAWTEQVARENGLELMLWSIDTHDWRGDSGPEMFAATAPRLGEGAVILAHDGIGPGALRSDPRETLIYTEMLGQHARAQGFRLVGLGAGAWT